MAVAKSSEKKKPAVPGRPRRANRPLSRKTLRLEVPSSNPRRVDVALTGDAVLSVSERRARDLALATLAAGRREAEARAGSVRLS
jgi:hypothetical protein